jgi:hypothetical protein
MGLVDSSHVAEINTGSESVERTLGTCANGGPYWARTSDLFHVKETL